MYVLREVTGLSFEKIGEAFGGRHHSTVRSALVRIKEEVVKNERLARVITRLVQRFSKPLPSTPGEVVQLPLAATRTPATCGFTSLTSAVSGALPRRTAG
jgi:hypothetical protein